jgi:hypothetical protein
MCTGLRFSAFGGDIFGVYAMSVKHLTRVSTLCTTLCPILERFVVLNGLEGLILKASRQLISYF